MSPETRAFLDVVRTAEDPTSEDERRVLTAVRATIATGATVGAGIALSKAAKLLGGGVSSGLKLGGLVVGISAIAWVASTTLATRSPEPPEKPAPAQQLASARVPLVASEAPLRTAPREAPDATPAAAAPLPSAKRVAPPAAASLREEIAVLAAVQAALDRGDGATALQRLEEHPSADRRLLAERRAARILALCLLGRTPEAEQSARTFLREHPSSVQRTAVERSCAGKATDPR